MAALVEVVRTPNVRYWSRYRLVNGNIVEEELTLQEYSALALPGAGPPPRKRVPGSAVWLCAAGGQVVWDTPTGLLELGDYEVLSGTNSVFVGMEELDPITLPVTRAGLLSLDATVTSRTRQYRIQAGTITRV
jgi:hypothetical protein